VESPKSSVSVSTFQFDLISVELGVGFTDVWALVPEDSFVELPHPTQNRTNNDAIEIRRIFINREYIFLAKLFKRVQP
jgi:hypothetical protein